MPTPPQPSSAAPHDATEAEPEANLDLVPLPVPVPGAAILSGLSERPLHEHAELYEGLHRDLQTALAEIDSA